MAEDLGSFRTIEGRRIPAPRSAAARALVRLVRFYQRRLSGFKVVSSCRFAPTCSAYALESVARHGVAAGLVLAAVRLAKCGPWHPGGYDPVPVALPGLLGRRGRHGA
ncbi:membrane protein insertion efficiency factor YidD [Corynebacterium otitidis]|uniref:membrane protein insertion efficiency factor YidD n=1 Tax=Corynebacterium otitidis TaxID=29321 RepID=UPI00062773E1|nr:membrane protein insertion efficiency factor YidD [Corynebacterium otitidis]KKO83806.1 membrane protein insertion efficiency factor [Corynebacterium otitidis]